MQFQFNLPVKILFEENAIQNKTELFSSYGKKALIITGKNAAKKSGALNDVCTALENSRIAYRIFDEISPNPDTTTIINGADYAKNNPPDFVIGIGGGSAIDAAKVIALIIKNEIPEEHLFTTQLNNAALPIIAIPTTAGTGTEVTPYSIITDKSYGNKRNLSAPSLFPKLAILDPKYTATLPKKTTIHTMVDALSHAAEGYLANRASPLSDSLALESIKTIGKHFSHPFNETIIPLQIRTELLYASMLAGIVITHTGTTVLHAMGYPLTYYKNIDHGLANGLLMSEFFRFSTQSQPEKTDTILYTLGFDTLEKFQTCLKKICHCNMQFTKQEIATFTKTAEKANNLNNTSPRPTAADIEKMLFNSLIV